jgi:site-specific recombinase XerC
VPKSWLDRYIEWGTNRAENPWTPNTARQYERLLRGLERFTGKVIENVNAEDLRSFQSYKRAEPAKGWNRRVTVITGFCQYLSAQGFYEHLDARGLRRTDPSGVLTKRKEEPPTPGPAVDVLAALAKTPNEMDRRIGLFLYHSGFKIGEASSIKEPPVEGKLHVLRQGGKWEWVPVSDKALDLLSQLGGRMPEGRGPRAIQRHLGVQPRQIQQASARDHQLRTSHGDALGPVWALLVGRPDLLKVARAYRDAVEEVEDPNGRPNDAITDAARALQEMLTAMGAQGHRLGPLFGSARSKGWFGPYDSKLADALESLVHWVSADRSGRGDTHADTAPGREDAWLALRIVAALLLRLEAPANR